MKHNLPFRDLDEEFEKWYELGPDDAVTLDEWIADAGSLRELAGYARVFWPEFVEHDGCVFRASAFSESAYADAMQWQKGRKTDVEAFLNHEHIASLFGNTLAEPPDTSAKSPSREFVVYVGRLLKDVWQAKLNRDFPGRDISVEFVEEDCEKVIDYQITFYQERDAQ